VERSPSIEGQPLASIDCTLFAGSRNAVVREFARHGLVFDLSEGAELRLEGRVSLWDRGGRYQFLVQRIDPAWAMGEQAARLRTLVDALSREGVLGANGELSVPLVPLNVGLVTSRGSAACEDFLHGLRTSGFPFRVFAAWSTMQGEGTAEGVMRAFHALLDVPGLDAAVLTRGGGSPLDLGWLDDPRIARTIAQLPWPVISAIGHETDSTLPDFAAHTRAKTPTHAADILVDRAAGFVEELDSLSVVLDRSVSRALASDRVRLAALAESLARSAGMSCRGRLAELRSAHSWLNGRLEAVFRSSERLLDRAEVLLSPARAATLLPRRRADLASSAARLGSASENRIARAGLVLDRLAEAVRGRDPVRLYRAGWATVTDASGAAVRSVGRIGTGERIRVRLLDGALEAQVLRTISAGPRKRGGGSMRKRTDDG